MTDRKWIVKYQLENMSDQYQIAFFDTKEEAFLFKIKHQSDKPVIFMEVELKLELTSPNQA